MNLLEIIYQDEYLIAVNKPAGLLVHASPIAADASEFLLQLLRDQIGKKVYPCHRLDRKTSGIILFTFSKETHALIRKQWEENKVEKQYIALVRGFVEQEGTIDYALTNEKGKIQEAVSHFSCLSKFEIPFSSGQFPTSRYSLIHLTPETGRFHQLRKHTAHIFHPIIGDRPHGCNKQNRFFLETFDLSEMCLHSSFLQFTHPETNVVISLNSEPCGEFKRIIELFRKFEA
ncbi:MAG: pseudouridylate synthase [Bacteroidetes bacterium]|nr:pseudouridylate synthase [Bacteroidota bacterium]